MSWRVLLLGLAAFLLALVVVLPARWIGGLLPAMIQCADWGGTIWRGRCSQLVVATPGVQPITLETTTWNLRPLPLLRARVAADVVLTDARGDAAGHVEFSLGGRLVLRDVSARARFDSSLPSAMPLGWSGRVEVAGLQVDWQDNELRDLQGDLQFFDLRDERGRAMGNYHVSFPPSSAPPYTGRLADLGGPLEIAGTLVLSVDRRWSLEGTVRPRPEADAAIARYLEFLGAADAAGRYPLSLSGSFE